MRIKSFILAALLFIFCCDLSAQPEMQMPKVPLMRQMFHNNIDEAQVRVKHLSGPTDTFFFATGDIVNDVKINKVLNTHINNLQARIELDNTLSENDKFLWLRAIESMLNNYCNAYRIRSIDGKSLTDVILSFEKALSLQKAGFSIAPVIAGVSYEVGKVILGVSLFETNVGYKEANDYLILKKCLKRPTETLKILYQDPDVFFADSLISIAARLNPDEMYDYATGEGGLGDKIRNSNDSLVKLVSHLSSLGSGRLYFPFLDLIVHKKITIDSITKILNNSEKYYKLLVSTEINFYQRIQKGDTPMVAKVLTEKLKSKALEGYVDVINSLHDAKSETERFKVLEKLAPQEMYYLCVLGEETIYTSSYLGVYKRIFERMKVKRSDSLFRLVGYDYYKKFIKMAAAYNQLEDLLNRMDTASSNKIMRSFVTALGDKNTLEDAVDVADSYASISNVKIKRLMLDQVVQNFRKDSLYNPRGAIIYKLLFTIFKSLDSTNHIDLTKELGINPIFSMPNKLLRDTSGKIVIQQFFFGDKDGKIAFNEFLESYKSPSWKIQTKEEWVEIASVKGIPVIIYANKPLDTEKDLDAQAQEHLDGYLDSSGLYPSVMIHRGHSYFLKYTLAQLQNSAKVVLLGSCGGYQSLSKVLLICPQAHIISSKQVGTVSVNQEIIETITEFLRLGKDLVWPSLWKTFSARFADDAKNKDKFNDYVPPHKNLGAIFIMAYEIAIANAKEPEQDY